MYQRLRNCLKQTAFMLALLVGSSSFLQAQNWDKVIKAVAGDRENHSLVSRKEYEYYGYSVAVSGDYAVVGTEGTGAYILQNINGAWKTIKKLNGRTYTYSGFGRSVAIDEQTIVVGAPSEEGGGAVYMYGKNNGGINNWGLVKKVTIPVSGPPKFGETVAISGNYIAVGVPFEAITLPSTLNEVGAVYLFRKDEGGNENWGFYRKIVAPSRTASSNFGQGLSMDGSYLVVGAYMENAEDGSGLEDTGAAYVFMKDKGGSDNWGLEKRILASDRSGFDYFGYSVDISGDYIIVGASYEDHDGLSQNALEGAGSAYIYKKDKGGDNNWGEVKKIIAPVRAEYDRFGWSVAITNDYAVVGAYLEDEDENEANTIGSPGAGSAYLFKRDEGVNGWGYVKKITAPVRAPNDNFGYAVAMNGNNVFVGATWEEEDLLEMNKVENAGSVYIFNKDQGGVNKWGKTQKVVAMYSYEKENFGYAVAIDGNYAVVGVPNEHEDVNGENPSNNAGAAYLFHNKAGIWTQIKKICSPIRPNNEYGDWFGNSVAIKGDYLVIGAPGENENEHETSYLTGAGAAYVYKKDFGGANNWGYVKKICAPHRGFADNFGRSVAIDGDYIVVGVPGDDEDAEESNFTVNVGSACIFKKGQGGSDNWGFVQKIVPSNYRSGENQFGNSVSMDEENIIIGAYAELAGAGAVYIFKKRDGRDIWNLNRRITAQSPKSGESFGYSVSISGDHAIVGAPMSNNNSSLDYSGTAYIFNKDKDGVNNWGLLNKITAPTLGHGDYFGWVVSMDNNYAVVGSLYNPTDELGANYIIGAGSAYIFKKEQVLGWHLDKKIVAPDRALQDVFGYSVAISGNQVIIGAYWEDEDAEGMNTITNAGSVYFFERACSEPLTLASSNITNKIVTISWAEPLSVPGGGYEYYYSTSSATPAANVTVSGSTSAGVTSANLSGLQPATTLLFLGTE